MGVAHHELACLRYLASQEELGQVLTIGRHWLMVDAATLNSELGFESEGSAYCEPLIRHLGASDVKSLDASDYEGADIVADMGIFQEPADQFDLVADFGSLEHIFNVPIAFMNMIRLCRIGGRIAHVLPANNLIGHGFWQFSSDLFFELYSPENGFEGTEVYYASGLDKERWFRTQRAEPGERFEFVSLEPIVIICISRKGRETAQLDQIAQPFYSGAWSKNSSDHLAEKIFGAGGVRSRVLNFIRRAPGVYRAVRNLRLMLGLASGQSTYSLRRCFESVEIRSLLAPPRGRQ